jgi:hypothetical protein
MNEVLGQAAGIKVELDVERLGVLISKQVAEQLAGLFPAEAAEFWAALCDQAYRERRRVASMLDLTCPHQDQCPHKPDVLSGLRFEGERHGQDEPQAAERAPGQSGAGPVDTAAGNRRSGAVGRRAGGGRGPGG